MRSAKFQQSRNATKIAIAETISRFRSSSRCSRNDIFGNSCSGSAPGEEGKSVVSELIYSACGVVGVSVGTWGVASAMTGAGSVLDIDWSGDIAALMVGGICFN